MSGLFQASNLDNAHGASEERTEPYMNTVEGIPEVATQRITKRQASMPSFAKHQVLPVWRLK